MNLLKSLNKLIGKEELILEKRWEFPIEEALLSPPAISLKDDGALIVFGTKKGNIYAITEDAKIKWAYQTKEKADKVKELFLDETAQGIKCSPVIADINNDKKDEVIVGSECGVLYVLKNDGKLLWQYQAQNAIRWVVAEDINDDGNLEIIFGSIEGNIYVANGKKLQWSHETGLGLEAKPAILRSQNSLQLIFGSTSGEIFSLNNKGKLLWNYKTNGRITAAPAIGDIYGDGKQYIILGSHDKTLYVLDEEGELKWKFETEGSIYSRACLADINNDKKQEIIFGSCDDKVYLLSCNGVKIWSYETDFWVVASPIAIDIDNDENLEIIAGSFDKSVYVLNGEGSFNLNYMPGLSGITHQAGSYSSIINNEPAQFQGKPEWHYRLNGMVISLNCSINKDKYIIIGTDSSLCRFQLKK